MPKYTKFLKNILSNKKKLEEISIVALNEECSAVQLNKPPHIPEKRNDPGTFLILCFIGGVSVGHALADLGASIDLMPYSVYKTLGLRDPKPTQMSIQLAHRSIKYPRGLIENLRVSVDRFIFPVDFVIMDMDEDKNVPLILGRPFLVTSRELVDLYGGKLTLRVNDEQVEFDINQSMKYSRQQDDLVFFIDVFEMNEEEPIEDKDEEVLDAQLGAKVEVVEALLATQEDSIPAATKADDDKETTGDEVLEQEFESKLKPSIEAPLTLELKPLPSHLKYAYLEGDHLPVIISSTLSDEEKQRLLNVLRAHKRAIRWKISDIQGISPAFCTHKILMEDDYKPSVQPQ